MKLRICFLIALTGILIACGRTAATPPTPTPQPGTAATDGPEALPATVEVTLQIFSGRPDPNWQLSDEQAADLQDQLAELSPGGIYAMPENLGYRGFNLNYGERAVHVYQDQVRITEAGEDSWRVDKSRTLEMWLLDSGVLAGAVEAEIAAEMRNDVGPREEGVALYLLDASIGSEMLSRTAAQDLARQSQALINETDIIAYDTATHSMQLTAEARQRIDELDFPVNGRPFVICVNETAIYAGAFWPLYSSLSAPNIVVIVTPLLKSDNSLELTLGYPGPDFFEGEDPRSDPRILDALEKSDKLLSQ